MLISIEEVMISLLTVLSPILEKRMMKMMMTAVEITPPVVVVYSLSPLYLNSLLVGKRSTVLKALLSVEKKEGIRFLWFKLLLIS